MKKHIPEKQNFARSEHRVLALFLLSVFMLTAAGKLNNGRGGSQGQREEAVSGSLTDSRMRTLRDGAGCLENRPERTLA